MVLVGFRMIIYDSKKGNGTFVSCFILRNDLKEMIRDIVYGALEVYL